MSSRLLLPIIAVLVLFLSACAPPPNLRDEALLKDTSLITGDPCEAPCWRGITPGETSWRDAVVAIEDDPQMTNIQRVDDEETGVRVIGWQDGEGPLCCQMRTSDGETVESILLLLAPDILLGELIDVIGEPTYLTGDVATDDQALMLLLYPEQSIAIYAFVEGPESGVLSETSEIIGSIYMTDDVMDEFLRLTNLYNWDGYQSYADYVDEQFDRTAVPETAADDDDIEAEATEESES